MSTGSVTGNSSASSQPEPDDALFSVTTGIELAPKPEPLAETISSRRQRATEPVFGKADFNILVVDDDQAILQLLQRHLVSEGFSCTTASNADLGLEAVAATRFHLVITDIRMPGLSGVEMADRIKAHQAGMLVIFMTGYAEYGALADAIKQRPFGFLEKPFGPSQLITLVERALAYTIARVEQKARASSLESMIVDKNRDLEFQTERLLAEKELLHGIISNANFGLIAIDTQRQVHLINAYAANLLDITDAAVSAVPGAMLTDLLPAELAPPFDGLYAESLDQSPPARRNISLTQGDSKLSILAYPVLHREKVTAIVFVIHDITETEMLQRRLLQTAKLASIGELAAGVAHEINNPLGFVMSNCSTLSTYMEQAFRYVAALEKERETQTLAPEATEAFKTLRQKCDIEYISSDAPNMLKETLDGLARVSKIVKDLKTFARSDSDTPQSCTLNTLLDDALNLVRNEIKYKLEVVREYGELPEVVCYPNQLVQVFTNMFLNAGQAVKEKGTLTITSRPGPRTVLIAIRDSGAGIPEKILSRVFDPFFTTKPPGKGTGMGLSISYGIIEKHGGTITVTSQVDVGTEFVIELPLNGVGVPPEGETGS